MATIVANGNRSVISPAYANTDNGHFEHALDSSYIKSTLNKGYTDSRKPKVFGESTVWKNGVAYPDSYWARIEVIPKEHPYIKGKWVHPDRYDTIKAYYDSREAAKSATQKAVSGGLNKVTNAAKNEAGNIKSGAKREAARYRAGSYVFDVKNNRYVYKGNKLGEAAAAVRGGVANTAAAKAAKNEASNIKSGAEREAARYRAGSYVFDTKNNRYVYKGNKLGEAAAAVRGGVASSAVGRAGKAAFEALTNKFDDFKKGINKYLTGADAGKNRSDALSKLREQAGGLISSIRSALGTSEGRSGIVKGAASALGTVTGTAAGVAKGIATSNIGKAAIKAGGDAYGAVKNKVGTALEAISNFFKKKYKSAPGGRVLEGA